MEKPQTWFASFIICKTHLNGANVTDVFFIGFYCLLIIITNAITRADAMIVTDTRPAKSNFIINNNASTSTIRLTSLLEVNHICLFSFPMFISIQYFFRKNKRTLYRNIIFYLQFSYNLKNYYNN